MAATKITSLTPISTIDTAVDPLPIVDVSDTSQASSGTTKKVTVDQIESAIFGATGSKAIVVDNVAALKALTVASVDDGQVFLTRGYYTDNDGGQGTYIYDAASSAADNGGTVIAPSSGSGRYKLQTDGSVNVKQFGAKGDFNTGTGSGTDDTASIQSAINTGTPVFFPSGIYLVTSLTISLPNVCLRGIKSSSLYGGSGVTIKTVSKTTNLITITNYGLQIFDIEFVGGSSNAESGSDATNSALVFQGATQKDIDATLWGCMFYLWNSCVKANGTNIHFEACQFAVSQFGFKSMSGSVSGWENRGFLFKNCRFHNIGKDGTTAYAVNCDPTHNVTDVAISGSTLCDFSMGLFSGFASGLTIDGVQMAKARGSGIVLDSTGHGVDARRRVTLISNFAFWTLEYITPPVNNCISATGLMSLSIDGVVANNIGGHGIVCSSSNASLKNIVIHDAGISANNTYDGIYISTTSEPFYLSNVTVTQDKSGLTRSNKARYGINYQSSGVSNSVFISTSFATEKINKAVGVVISRDNLETGTFTPTLIGNSSPGTATYSQRKGRFVRVGDLVHCEIYLDWSGGTGSGNGIITGLPFTSNSYSPAVFPVIVNGITPSSGRYPIGYISTSSTEIYLQEAPAAGGASGIISQPYSASGSILATFSYSVSS